MAYIEKIAFHLGRRDEVPNQELAALLAGEENVAGIEEIAGFLHDKNKSVQSDCIKVLYEIGYINPRLIAKYAEVFAGLLESKVNRMVWGAMIALSTIAAEVPDDVWPYVDRIKNLIENGTVITNVSGVRTLIRLAGSGKRYHDELVDDLFRLQRACRDVDFAKRAEEMWRVIRLEHREAYRRILEERMPNLGKAAQNRLAKAIAYLSITTSD